MEYNHLEYMENVATSLKEIAHSSNHKAFATASGMGLLEGLMEGITSLNLPCLVAIDDVSSRLAENDTDSISEVPFYSFCILKVANTNDSLAQRKAMRECKVLVKKVISKLRTDRRNGVDGLKYFDTGSVLISGIGPVAGGYYGCSVSFSLLQPAGVVYNASDWL